jgi:hypothetical protein
MAEWLVRTFHYKRAGGGAESDGQKCKKNPEDQGDLIFRSVVVAPMGTVKCVDI